MILQEEFHKTAKILLGKNLTIISTRMRFTRNRISNLGKPKMSLKRF